MSYSGVPQLFVGPNESSSLILSDSVFTTAQLILTGVSGTGVALGVTNTSDDSITTLGGISVSGPIYSFNQSSNSINTQGGVYVEKDLEINQNIFVSGDIILGTTTNYTSDLFFGPPNTNGTYKISHDNSVNGGRLMIYMYDSSLNAYDLLMKLERFC